MRSVPLRLAALVAGVVIVASCDTRLPTTATVTSGGGGAGGSSSPSKTVGPTIVIDSPLVGALINVGDSVLVTVRLHDNKALKNASIVGVAQTGSVDLGTFAQRVRYTLVNVPGAGNFRPGLRDTTVRRYIQPVSQADTALDSLVVIVIATDSVGVADTASTRINLVAGPKVSVVSPTNGDSIPAGVGLSVSARATHPSGVGRIDIRVQGEANWPTKFDTSFTQVYTTNPRDITFTAVARVPINAPLRGRITITATAVDVDRQPGSSSPVAVFVRSPNAATPRVTQTVPPKSEFSDSVIVRATGEAITTLGLVIRDSANTIIQTDTLKLLPPFNANVQASVALNLLPSQQGKKLGITAFAIDQAGRVGYAVPATRNGSEGDRNAALIDSTLVVYGRTYALPRQGVVGDIAVDAPRGNVFLSNTEFNILEVWQNATTVKGFGPGGVAVGSLPWGLFISNNPDTLLVANSGGTNISRVFIGSGSAGALHEDLASRILTRNSYVFTVTFQRDENTGKIRITADGPISYSDRPQYLAQSAGGRIFYSTRPTATAPAGTIRWLNPSQPVPDSRQIWQYGTHLKSTELIYALFDVDSIDVLATVPSAPESDRLVIYDHPNGQRSGSIVAIDSIPERAAHVVDSLGGDASTRLRLDVGSLALTDTTFAAASGNRKWLAFGEGHKTGAGRVMMMADSIPSDTSFFVSPLVTISDLTDNASEQVFGLALDLNGATVASHGTQSYFAAVSDPFHLRLQGKYDSFDNGAGIAFHPNANGTLTPAAQRLAFVGASSGIIEIVDIAYYINRGKLQLKNPIYGPIRASLAMPGDPPGVIMKLFAMSKQGLIVIDLTATDIKPGP